MNTMDGSTGRRRALWRAVSIVIVGGLLGLTPLTATASDEAEGADETTGDVQMLSISQCGARSFCLWSNSGFTGTFTQTTSPGPTAVSSTTSRSVLNKTGRAVRVFSGANGTGSSVCYAPNAQFSSVSITSRSIVVLSGTAC